MNGNEYIFIEAGYVETGPALIQVKIRTDVLPDDDEIELAAERIRDAVERHRRYQRGETRSPLRVASDA